MGKAVFSRDLATKTIRVERTFAAPLETVWNAWTTADILDQWWGPAPWHAETTTLELKVGGMWHYAMVGPDGERSYCRADYDVVQPPHRFAGQDSFCDEHGTMMSDPPGMHWDVQFESVDATTTNVMVTIQFATEADMEKIVAMGFQQGFTTGMEQLEALLANE